MNKKLAKGQALLQVTFFMQQYFLSLGFSGDHSGHWLRSSIFATYSWGKWASKLTQQDENSLTETSELVPFSAMFFVIMDGINF